jgi:uncharacterized membrane protein
VQRHDAAEQRRVAEIDELRAQVQRQADELDVLRRRDAELNARLTRQTAEFEAHIGRTTQLHIIEKAVSLVAAGIHIQSERF